MSRRMPFRYYLLGVGQAVCWLLYVLLWAALPGGMLATILISWLWQRHKARR